MESFLVSTGIVALAEMGDKTQLLAFVLAARFRKPLPIIAGILVATIINHVLASIVGLSIASFINPIVLSWILGLSFLAMAIWILIPDSIDDEETKPLKFGVFITTVILFFMAEMGDKTQIATVMLAAKYQSVLWVSMGTTFGMMLANVPAVYVGDRLAKRMSIERIHQIVAFVFVIFAVLSISHALGWM